jgi:hypothetical protein
MRAELSRAAVRRLVVFGALLWAVAACTASNSGSDESTDPESAPSFASAAAALPLSVTFERVDDLSWAIDALLEPLVASCMASKGFETRVAPPIRPPSISPTDKLGRRYFAPQIFHDTVGYAFDMPASRADQAPSESLESDPAYVAALVGELVEERKTYTSSGELFTTVGIGDGCNGQAVIDVFGTADAYFSVFTALNSLQSLGSESLFRLRSDERFLGVSAKWSRCMSGAGYEFDGMFDSPDREWAEPRPSAEEQAVAEADLKCRSAVGGSVEDLSAIEGSIQTGLLEANPDLAARVSTLEAEIVALIRGAEND